MRKLENRAGDLDSTFKKNDQKPGPRPTAAMTQIFPNLATNGSLETARLSGLKQYTIDDLVERGLRDSHILDYGRETSSYTPSGCMCEVCMLPQNKSKDDSKIILISQGVYIVRPRVPLTLLLSSVLQLLKRNPSHIYPQIPACPQRRQRPPPPRSPSSVPAPPVSPSPVSSPTTPTRAPSSIPTPRGPTARKATRAPRQLR